MRSLREPKALTIQPMRCRSNQNIAEILSKRPQQNSFQVVHFTSARRFDDGQDTSLFVPPATSRTHAMMGLTDKEHRPAWTLVIIFADNLTRERPKLGK